MGTRTSSDVSGLRNYGRAESFSLPTLFPGSTYMYRHRASTSCAECDPMQARYLNSIPKHACITEPPVEFGPARLRRPLRSDVLTLPPPATSYPLATSHRFCRSPCSYQFSVPFANKDASRTLRHCQSSEARLYHDQKVKDGFPHLPCPPLRPPRRIATCVCHNDMRHACPRHDARWGQWYDGWREQWYDGRRNGHHPELDATSYRDQPQCDIHARGHQSSHKLQKPAGGPAVTVHRGETGRK